MTLEAPTGKAWVSSCRKWRYATRPEAMDALVEARANRGEAEERAERSVYRCPRCRGYHLTHRLASDPNYVAPELRPLLCAVAG